jgi:virginiamycin B lyase
VSLLSHTTSEFNDITVDVPTKSISLEGQQTIPITLTASQSALPDTYKVLLSARTDDVTVSQFVTVTIPQ